MTRCAFFIESADNLLFVGIYPFQDRISETFRKQLNSTNGIVIGRNHIVDHVGIAVGVHQGHNRDIEALGLRNRNVLALGVHNEQRRWKSSHLTDTAKVLHQLVTGTLKSQNFFLRKLSDAFLSQHPLDFTQFIDALLHSLIVREHPTQPSIGHVGHLAALGCFLDDGLRLSLCRNKQDCLPA